MDGRFFVFSFFKPKASSSNEAGEGTKTSSGSSKKRKTSAESGAGPKKTPKVPDQQAVLADRLTGSVESSSSAQQRLGEGASMTPSVDGVISTAPGATADAASSAAAVSFSGDANGSGAAASVPQEGDGASSGNGGITTPKNSDARNKDSSVTDAAGAGAAASAANAFENGGTGGGGKGGSGEKNGKNGTKPPALSWDPDLETAMTKFEEGKNALARREGGSGYKSFSMMGMLLCKYSFTYFIYGTGLLAKLFKVKAVKTRVSRPDKGVQKPR